MHNKLMDCVCKELKDLETTIEKQGGITMDDLRRADLLTHTKASLLKCEKLMSEDEQGDDMYRRGYRRPYRGEAYSDNANGSGGSYGEAMGGYGAYERRDSRGRFMANRYGDGYGENYGENYGKGRTRNGSDELIEELHGMLQKLPANVRLEMQQVLDKHRND